MVNPFQETNYVKLQSESWSQQVRYLHSCLDTIKDTVLKTVDNWNHLIVYLDEKTKTIWIIQDLKNTKILIENSPFDKNK